MDGYEDDQPTTPTNRLDRLEMDIEDLCRSMRNEEVSEEELQEHFLDFTAEQLKSVVNRMIKNMKLQVKTDEHHKTSVKLRDSAIVRKLIGMDEDEIKVYEAIESTGNKGIPSKYIRTRTKLSATKLTKTLSTLEGKQLIKAVKLQRNSQHVKSYLLFHLKPDDAALGTQTVFGVGTGFDAPLFDMVSKLCGLALKNKMKDFVQKGNSSEATAEEILGSVVETGAVKAELTEESIEAALKMLELNGKVEKRLYKADDGQVIRYRLHTIRSDKPEAAIPCVGCPVKHLCSFNSPVNPIDCPHYDTWWKRIDF